MNRITLDGRSLADRVGEVAGRVWHQLRAHGPQTQREVSAAIGRTETDVLQAIGWLAREGKVQFEQENKIALVAHEMTLAY